MKIFAQRLNERASQLGMTNNDVARQCGIEERTYAHYTKGDREPNLTALVRIAAMLKTTPDWLLGLDHEGKQSVAGRTEIEARILATCRTLDLYRLRTADAVVTAIAEQPAVTKGRAQSE